MEIAEVGYRAMFSLGAVRLFSLMTRRQPCRYTRSPSPEVGRGWAVSCTGTARWILADIADTREEVAMRGDHTKREDRNQLDC